MNDKKYAQTIKFFEEECQCEYSFARKLAGYVDNIVFNARMEKNDAFIQLVAFGIRNAYWDGQINAIFEDDKWNE